MELSIPSIGPTHGGAQCIAETWPEKSDGALCIAVSSVPCYVHLHCAVLPTHTRLFRVLRFYAPVISMCFCHAKITYDSGGEGREELRLFVLTSVGVVHLFSIDNPNMHPSQVTKRKKSNPFLTTVLFVDLQSSSCCFVPIVVECVQDWSSLKEELF
jgi:hypothetical protein